MGADHSNWFNSNIATNIWVQVKLGSTVIFDSGLIGTSASVDYGAWRLEGELVQNGPKNQTFYGRYVMAQPGSTPTTALPLQTDIIGNLASSVDMTADQILEAIVAPSTTAFVWSAEQSKVTVF